MLVISEADVSSSHQLAVGEEVILRLPENPTTGYRWQFTPSGSGRLRLLTDRFESGASGGTMPPPGAAGHRVLHFVAEHGGDVQLALVNKRASPAVASGDKQLTFAILVR